MQESPPRYTKEMRADKPQALIAVMGATGSGKTSFINLASGSSLRVGDNLRSCTNVIQFAQPFTLDGREVILMDTPGFDDTTKSDTEVLRMISETLALVYENKKTLAGVIYMHRISDFRMGGISTRNFKMFRKLCGDETLRNVIIVTNMWGEVDKKRGSAREEELARDDLFFKPVLDKAAIMMRHENAKSLDSAYTILRSILENHPLPLKIQRELVDEKKEFSETDAAEELNRELAEQLRKHKEEMKQLQQEMEEAILEKDMETKRELEKAAQDMQAKMSKVQAEQEQLKSKYDAEKAEMRQRFDEYQEQARHEREEAANRHNERIAHLEHQLRNTGRGFFASLGRAIDSIFS